jgi:hypothetical protein
VEAFPRKLMRRKRYTCPSGSFSTSPRNPPFDGYGRVVHGKGLLAFVFGCFEDGADGKDDGKCMV